MEHKTSIRRFKHLVNQYTVNINDLQRDIDATISEIEDSTRMMNRNELSYARYPYLDSEETKRYDAVYWGITNKLLLMMPKAYDVHKAAEPVSNYSLTGARGIPLSDDTRPPEADLTVRGSHKSRYMDIAKKIEDTFGDSAYDKKDFFSVSVKFMKSPSFANSRYNDGRLMAQTLAEQITQAMSGIELGDVKPVKEGWEEYEQKMLDAEIARAQVLTESRQSELDKVQSSFKEHVDVESGKLQATSDALAKEKETIDKRRQVTWVEEKTLTKREKELNKREKELEKKEKAHQKVVDKEVAEKIDEFVESKFEILSEEQS